MCATHSNNTQLPDFNKEIKKHIEKLNNQYDKPLTLYYIYVSASHRDKGE